MANPDYEGFWEETFWGAFGEGGVLGPPDEEVARQDAQKDKLMATAEKMALPTPDNDKLVSSEEFIAMASRAGIDTDNPDFQALVAMMGEGLDTPTAQLWVQMLASDPKYQSTVLATPYNQALESSGFGVGYTYPSQDPNVDPRLYRAEGMTPPVPSTITSSESGWTMFKNGVLVNPVAMDVYYQPNSLAPGSPWWYQQVVSKWSADKINGERKHLVDLGYLPKGAESGGLDAQFQIAVSEYHRYRYLNNGREVAYDATAAEADKPSITAKDYRNKIRNNVRKQFMAVFGEEPTDAELDSWARFTTREAVEYQREFQRAGASPEEAVSAGMTEAAEKTARKLWESPLATHTRENTLENTKMRDAIMRSISATEGLLS